MKFLHTYDYACFLSVSASVRVMDVCVGMQVPVQVPYVQKVSLVCVLHT